MRLYHLKRRLQVPIEVVVIGLEVVAGAYWGGCDRFRGGLQVPIKVVAIGSEVVAGTYRGGCDRFRGGCRYLLRWL